MAHPAPSSDPLGPQNQYPAQGLPVKLINHSSHAKAAERVWNCQECGAEVASYLKDVLEVGLGEQVVIHLNGAGTAQSVVCWAAVVHAALPVQFSSEPLVEEIFSQFLHGISLHPHPPNSFR